jgi:hypothetical protein
MLSISTDESMKGYSTCLVGIIQDRRFTDLELDFSFGGGNFGTGKELKCFTVSARLGGEEVFYLTVWETATEPFGRLMEAKDRVRALKKLTPKETTIFDSQLVDMLFHTVLSKLSASQFITLLGNVRQQNHLRGRRVLQGQLRKLLDL